jgi:hypothetical protein
MKNQGQFIAFLCSLLLFSGFGFGQQSMPAIGSTWNGGGGGGTNTFTLVQAPTTIACATPSCTITINGSGHLVDIQYAQINLGSAQYITSVSGQCSSWLIPSSSQTFSATNGSLNHAYCLSTSGSGTATISVPTTGHVKFFEYSYTPGPIALDNVCVANTNGTSSTSQNGQTLTLTGTKDVVIQAWNSGGAHATAAASPFSTNFDGGGGISDLGTADNENTSSGTPPSPLWTLNTAATGMTSACAFK